MRYLILLMFPFILFSCQKKAVQSDIDIKTEIVKKGTLEDGATQEPIRVAADGTPEKFVAVDVKELNAQVSKAYDELQAGAVLAPLEIMQMLFPNEANMSEGNELLSYEEGPLGNDAYRVIMTHDNMPDDSVNGEKYVMLLSKQGDRWSVISLEKNWKCQEDRGDITWGIEPCK